MTTDPNITDGFHLVVDALKLNKIDTIYGVAGIPVTDLMRLAQSAGMACSPTGLMHDARYDRIIEAFGGTGYHVTNASELTQALSEALTMAKPALINAMIDPTAGTESGHIHNLNPKSALASQR